MSSLPQSQQASKFLAEQAGELVEEFEEPIGMGRLFANTLIPMAVLGVCWLACGGSSTATAILFPMLYCAYVWQVRMNVGRAPEKVIDTPPPAPPPR